MRLTTRGNHLGLLAFGLVLLLATMFLPTLGSASGFHAGFNVNVSTPTSDNLYLASFRAKVTAPVEGDVNLAAATSEVDATIGGSVHVLSGQTTLRGTINGSVYVMGGLVRVEGTVQGDLIVTGGRVVIADSARIGGDFITFGAQTRMDGEVGGKMYGTVVVLDQNGSVSGNLEMQADRLHLGDNASVGDSLRYQSQTGADISNGARIGGEMIRTNATPWNGVGDGALAPFGTMLRLIWAIAFGAILIGIAPRLMDRFSEHASSVVTPGIWGVIGMIAIPVFAIFALASVLLVPVGVLLLIGYVIALYLSQIVVGITLGRWLLPRRWHDGSRGYLLLALVLGLIIIGALRMAPVPYLNALILVLVTFWGFGAILLIISDLTSSRLRVALDRRFR